MKTQFALLKKENKLRAACLRPENQVMLDRWIAYARSSDMNPYDFELCYKELIGIALQKEAEGKDLKHFFGEHQKEIAENIVSGCRKKTFKDYFLFNFRDSVVFFCFLSCLTFFRKMFDPLDAFYLLTYLIITIASPLEDKLLSSKRFRRLLFTKNLEINLLSRLILLCLICILLFPLLGVFFPFLGSSTLPVPNIVIPIGYGILWIILTIYQNKYTNELAATHPWQDA